MDALYNIVVTINSYLSNYILIVLLVGTGLWFSIRTGFVQVRFFGEGVKRLFGGISLNGEKQKSGMSSFQALATAVAAQVGTGNIVGACGAILIGGPGAIFWMWIIAFLGMATNYAEAVLAQKTRVVKEDGTVLGGPVYYIKRAFKGGFGTFLAGFFAVAIILALGFMGCMVQSNSIASTMSTATGIPAWAIGLFVVLFAAFIFVGGVQRLASVVEKVVPFMAVIYLVGGLAVLIANAANIIPALQLIFECAFNPQAQVGGVTFGLIAALSQGAKRGLFSNEAGMGSTPHAHALANVKTPHEQGVVAMIAVFIDTFVVVTMTALVVISCLYVGDGALAVDATGATAGLDKTNMAQVAFGSLFGQSGGAIFVAVCLFFFAFSTILSWNLFAKINVEYLFGKKALPIFTVIALVFIFLGSLLSNDLVWELADMFNQLMVIPNVIALFALTGAVTMCVKTRGEKMEIAQDAKAIEEPKAE
ncbi:MAG: sodium:alanine symporter family protein [Eggerthellaceae bacterium]|nr:sodium:alanine symporter family protein [Eggerthellaceae bacterium]